MPINIGAVLEASKGALFSLIIHNTSSCCDGRRFLFVKKKKIENHRENM